MPPGWYPDPGTGMQRWWDGQAWGPVAPPAAVQQPHMMVSRAPKRTSHGLHLFLTIITFGAWGVFVWLPLTIIHKFQREKTVTRIS